MSLLAGFAKIYITPEYAVGLGGYSNAESRRSEGVEARIYTTCIALTDGDETILVYTIDNCACSHEIAEKMHPLPSKKNHLPFFPNPIQ
jgi:hypothetical protein